MCYFRHKKTLLAKQEEADFKASSHLAALPAGIGTIVRMHRLPGFTGPFFPPPLLIRANELLNLT